MIVLTESLFDTLFHDQGYISLKNKILQSELFYQIKKKTIFCKFEKKQNFK